MTAESPPAAGIPRLRLDEFVERLATRTPTPGGGAVLAVSAAMAASLVQMVIGYTEPEHLGTAFPPSRLRGLESLGVQALRLAQQDATAYAEYVRSARDASARRRAGAAIVAIPLAVCEIAATIASAAADLASGGNPRLAGDSAIAAHQAAAAATGAARLVAANLGDGAAYDLRGSRASLLASRARAAVESLPSVVDGTSPVQEHR